MTFEEFQNTKRWMESVDAEYLWDAGRLQLPGYAYAGSVWIAVTVTRIPTMSEPVLLYHAPLPDEVLITSNLEHAELRVYEWALKEELLPPRVPEELLKETAEIVVAHRHHPDISEELLNQAKQLLGRQKH